jgi:hypothetical protein
MVRKNVPRRIDSSRRTNAVSSYFQKRVYVHQKVMFCGYNCCDECLVVVIVNAAIIFECMFVYTCDYYIIRLFVDVMEAVMTTAMVLIQCCSK